MNEQDQMRQFAENLWNQFFANKVDKAMAQTVSYFRARVTDNPGSGKLEVQRPFDTAHIVSCTDALSNASAGDEVTVFVFGSENGNNAVAVSDGSMSTLGSGGGGGGSVAWSDVTGKPSTIAGYGITDAKIVSGTITLGTMTITPVVDNSYVHTDNNFTTTLLNKLNGIEAGAEVNVIEEVQKNGTPLTVSGKSVNVTVPTKTSDLTNDSNFVESGDLATVATTGDYGDLINTPSIPTVNDATLTIQKNGTTVQTFTANASANATANITVPTQTSELTNNSGFITSADVPTSTSELTNDSGFITSSDLTTDIITNASASTWVSDSTYTGYGYKCNIDVSGYGVDSTTFAEVTFGADEATSGNYAPVCTTGTNTVTVYSKVSGSITIPSILIVRAS